MKKVRNLLLVLVASFFLQPVLGQSQFRIKLDSTSLSTLPPATTKFDTVFNFNVILINEGPVDYRGVMDLAYVADSVNIIEGSRDTTGFEYLPLDTFIQTNESVTVPLIAHVEPSAFKAGPSVVVIWPIRTAGDNFTFLDSLRFLVNTLENPTGIDEADRKKLRAFIWNNQLQIQKQPEIQLKRVRIYDILGKEILNLPNPADRTALPEMNTGIYVAEITYNDNKRAVFRFYND